MVRVHSNEQKTPGWGEHLKEKESAMLKRSSIVLAVALVLFAFGVASAGQIDGLRSNNGPLLPSGAVYVNPGGTGDTLLYNYYNARNNMTTYFTVVNTDTASGARVRLRFNEAADIAEKTAYVILKSHARQL
jgi:hypothetical protein